MTGFLLYLAGFFVTWYLGARILYNSEFVNELSSGKGESVIVSLFFSGVTSIMWPITLPFIGIYYLIRFLSAVYGSSITDSFDKFLDNGKE
jgi:hypothetical protein